jgi:outer membrane protein assembly factor BamB
VGGCRVRVRGEGEGVCRIVNVTVRACFARVTVQVWTAPALSADGVLVVGHGNGGVYALSASSGDLLWRFQAGGPITMAPVIDSQGIVYAGELQEVGLAMTV